MLRIPCPLCDWCLETSDPHDGLSEAVFIGHLKTEHGDEQVLELARSWGME